MHSDMQHVYTLYFMYFDTWKQLNYPWYEKTNQQRFQLKVAWSWSAIDYVQSPADWHKNRAGARHILSVYLISWRWNLEQFQKRHKI